MIHWLKTSCISTTFIKSVGIWLSFFILLSCGLPNTRGVVPEASGIRTDGNEVTFTLIESSGFYLHYRFYRDSDIGNIPRDLSTSTRVGERAIFASFGYHKAYPPPPASTRQSFIWQPSPTDSAPYTVKLNALDGTLEVRDSGGVIFEVKGGGLLRDNLLNFTDFEADNSDIAANNVNSGSAQLTWAVMNTRLDPALIVLDVSNATFLHGTSIIVR